VAGVHEVPRADVFTVERAEVRAGVQLASWPASQGLTTGGRIVPEGGSYCSPGLWVGLAGG
jgi:hypothetical protein